MKLVLRMLITSYAKAQLLHSQNTLLSSLTSLAHSLRMRSSYSTNFNIIILYTYIGVFLECYYYEKFTTSLVAE